MKKGSKNNTPKSRHALVLFHNDSPFKPKIVKSAKAYSRKKKHKNNDE